MTQLDEASVAALAGSVAGSDIVEELGEDFAIVEATQGEAAGVEITALAESDELLGDAAKLFRFGFGGLNPLVPEQAGDEVGEHGLTVAGVAAEFTR